MSIATGRAGTVTPKDNEIFQTLFFARYLTTNQLASLFYNSAGRARTRLYQLANKKYLESRVLYTVPYTKHSHGKRETVWHLSKEAFEMVAGDLEIEADYTPKQLGEKRTRDCLKANEVFVVAKPLLEEELGEYPSWEWRHEKRAYDYYWYREDPQHHRPDAQVLFCDHLFIIERQTRESHVTREEIYDKVSGHRLYVTIELRKDLDEVEVLFACDDERVAEIARRAGEHYGISVRAYSPYKTADYLYNRAAYLS